MFALDNTLLRRFQPWLTMFFFLATLLLGLGLFRDYGFSWDESMQRDLGKITLDYLFQHDPTLLTHRDRYHGLFFETVLAGLERVSGLTDSRKIFFLRHAATFFYFWLGSLFFYLLLRRLTGSWGWSLFGLALYWLAPRLWAEAFYNSKDIPLLAAFCMAFYTLHRFLEKGDYRSGLWHALTTGIAIDIRVLGVLLTAITVAAWVAQKNHARNGPDSVFQAKPHALTLYVVACLVVTILFWPTLWGNPFQLLAALLEMKKYPFIMGGFLHQGEIVDIHNLPWTFLPIWIGITTPLATLALTLCGWARWIWEGIRHAGSWRRRLFSYCVAVWAIAPVFFVVVLHSTVYDGWRHVYFIYPALVIAAVAGGQWLFQYARSSVLFTAALTLVIGVNLAAALGFMIQSHPYQNVYFNALVGGARGAKNNYELDYWGLSYRRGLEYLVRHVQQPVLRVYADTYPAEQSLQLLTPTERERFLFVKEKSDADFHLTTFRFIKEYRYQHQKLFFSIQINQVNIMAIYDLRPAAGGQANTRNR